MAVTFVSNGYDTTSTTSYTEKVWADAFPSIGSAEYGVRSPADWKVTAVAGADRTVSIAAGHGFGHGVTDATASNDTIQLDPVGSGSRWDLIVARRDWTPTGGETKFARVVGGADRVIPAGRLVDPGGIDDQPLALVQVSAGKTEPTAIVDLRCWAGNGGVVAKDILARDYLNILGASVNIGGVTWQYGPGANDVPAWTGSGPVNGGAATALTAMRGTWTAPFADNRKPRVWSSDGITAHSTGLVQYNGSDKNILTIPSQFAPADPGSITYVGAAQMSGAGSVAGGPSVHLGINAGVLQVIYQGGTLPSGGYLPITGSWRING